MRRHPKEHAGSTMATMGTDQTRSTPSSAGDDAFGADERGPAGGGAGPRSRFSAHHMSVITPTIRGGSIVLEWGQASPNAVSFDRLRTPCPAAPRARSPSRPQYAGLAERDQASLLKRRRAASRPGISRSLPVAPGEQRGKKGRKKEGGKEKKTQKKKKTTTKKKKPKKKKKK